MVFWFSALNKKNDESHEIAREFYKGTDTDIASTSNHTSEVMNDIGVVGASTSTSIKHVGRWLATFLLVNFCMHKKLL